MGLNELERQELRNEIRAFLYGSGVFLTGFAFQVYFVHTAFLALTYGDGALMDWILALVFLGLYGVSAYLTRNVHIQLRKHKVEIIDLWMRS